MNKSSIPSLLICLFHLLTVIACNDNATTAVSSSPLDTIPNSKTDTSPLPNEIQQELDQLEEQRGNSNRTIWQQPRMIIQQLGDLKNKTVADIGAGPSGYFSFQLVGEAKKVIAIDINPSVLTFMDSLKLDILPTNKQEALETRLAVPDNPNLKDNEADVVILMNIYAYLPNPARYLATLKKGLTKNGKLLIVDFKMRQLPIGPTQEEKAPLYKIEEELNKAGFQIQIVDDCSLDYQYMVIANKG